MIKVESTRFEHIASLSKTLRYDDRQEIILAGNKPYEVIKKGFKQSLYCKTALVDNEVAAMWGVVGVLMGHTGRPWFLTGTQADKVSPLSFARLYASEVDRMLGVFPKLENYCWFGYTKSLKLLRLCGFTVGEPEPVGVNGALFCRFSIER